MTPLNLRRFRFGLAYVLMTLPFIVFGAIRSLDSNVNSPIDWVPASFPPRADYDAFCDLFGPGDTVIASWEVCTVDTPQLDELARVLRESSQFQRPDGNSLFSEVICGREVVNRLAAGPGRITHDEAVRRFQHTLVGPDGRTTCFVIAFTPEALAERSRIVPKIQDAIEDVCGVSPADQHLAGPVMDGLSVDQASQSSLNRLALPSMVVVLIAACVCLRSIRAGLFVFAIAAYCQAATLAIVYFGGETMSALLIVLPPLIQVLAVAGGVHLTNYYLDALPEYGAGSAPLEALRRGWLPCVLSAGTTALGLASLAVSQLTPIRSFGIFAAAGVLLTTVVLLPLLPVLWIHLPVRDKRSTANTTARRHFLASSWTRFVHRHRWAIMTVAGLLAIVLGSYLPQLRSSVRIETLFPPTSRLVRDYGWIEAHVGKLVPIEIIVSCDTDCPLELRDRLRLIERIGREANRSRFCGGVQSAVQFLPVLPDRSLIPPQQYAALLSSALAQTRQVALDAGRLLEDSSGEHWRVTMFVGASDDLNYSDFLVSLEDHLAPLLNNESGTPVPGVTVRYTGIMPLVHAIQERLLRDLFCSFLMAFAIILLVVIIAQAGVAAGLVTMIPNVFPAVILFGWLGWSKTDIDIGTVMTASAALGIAVDDTFHFLAFFRRSLAAGRDTRHSVEFAIQHCALAMIQTSLICGLGLAVFALSDFTPTSRFAWTMVSMFGLALVGDLLLLPALLLGPAGRWFESSIGAESAASDSPADNPVRYRTPAA